MTVASDHGPVGQGERDSYLDNLVHIVENAPRSPESQHDLVARFLDGPEAGE